MPNPLVECIPNFSDARRPEVIQAILNAISAVNDIHILDRHSDIDHNRTVITFIGSPAAVEEAAFQAIKTAAGLIDLNLHTGEHPRIGATDVVPFVPIADISLVECVEIARRLGKRVGLELSLPVYLYEEAASRPDRQNLENIRRGQFEGLKQEILTNSDRKPDFGPAELGPAGATVIGARQPLIAFNVYLTTEDVSIAQKIARSVRNSSGGLRFIKAMGVLVEGRAQVSMNLTNYRQTPIARVVEMVRREAARYGVGVHHSELVGLIPQEALTDAAQWYLQLDGFEPAQVLESRLYEIRSSLQATILPNKAAFLDDLASANPTPGGGAAAAFTAGEAAALVTMVTRVTIGKKKYAAVEADMWSLQEKAELLRVALTHAVGEDSAAFEDLLAAIRLPRETPAQQFAQDGANHRDETIQKATLQAARVPLKVAKLANQVLELAVEAARLGNINAISDAGSAAALARAALTGAGLNVRTNLKGMESHLQAVPMLAELCPLETRADELEKVLHQILVERGELTF